MKEELPEIQIVSIIEFQMQLQLFSVYILLLDTLLGTLNKCCLLTATVK